MMKSMPGQTMVILRLVLSHHPPSQASRTFRVPLGSGNGFRICARCTGQLIGALVGALFVSHWHLSLPSAIIIGSAFPVAAIWDWTTQARGCRESHNILRVTTGAMFALGCVIIGRLLFAGDIAVGLLALLIVGSQGTLALCILRRCGAIERILDELDREATAFALAPKPKGNPVGAFSSGQQDE